MDADPKELAARLRRLACGTVEWRVANPETGDYCIGFDSEPKAREWLADHVKRFPNSMHADKAVTRVLYRTELERAALEAAELLAPAGVAAAPAPLPQCPFCKERHEHCDSPGAIVTKTTGCPKIDGTPGVPGTPAPSAVRVCTVIDAMCTRQCYSGPCKLEQSLAKHAANPKPRGAAGVVAAPAPDLLRRCLDTVNALLGDMEGQGSWTQIDDDLLPELQARQRELTAACGVKVEGGNDGL